MKLKPARKLRLKSEQSLHKGPNGNRALLLLLSKRIPYWALACAWSIRGLGEQMVDSSEGTRALSLEFCRGLEGIDFCNISQLVSWEFRGRKNSFRHKCTQHGSLWYKRSAAFDSKSALLFHSASFYFNSISITHMYIKEALMICALTQLLIFAENLKLWMLG